MERDSADARAKGARRKCAFGGKRLRHAWCSAGVVSLRLQLMKPIRHSLRSSHLAMVAGALSAASHAAAQQSDHPSSEVSASPAIAKAQEETSPAVEAVPNDRTPVDADRARPSLDTPAETSASDVK